MEETKTCSKCGEVKRLSFFHKRKGGYRSWCKNCRYRFEDQRRIGRRMLAEQNKEKKAAEREALLVVRKKKNALKSNQTRRKKRIENYDEHIARERERYRRSAPEISKKGFENRNKLKGTYVKWLLRKSKIDKTCFTPEIIELKREQIKLHRALNEAKNGIA